MDNRVIVSLPAIHKIILDAEALINETAGIKVKLHLDMIHDYNVPQKIVDVICDYFHLNWIEIVSHSRKRELVIARQCFIYLLFNPDDPERDSNALGRFLHRDRTTIPYHFKQVCEFLNIGDETITTAINELKTRLENETTKS